MTELVARRGWLAFTSDRDAQPGNNSGMWEHLQSTGVYVVQPDGTGLRRVTRNGGIAGSPSWSADGRRILFYETDPIGAYLAKSAGSRTELASVDVTTDERTQYTASRERAETGEACVSGIPTVVWK